MMDSVNEMLGMEVPQTLAIIVFVLLFLLLLLLVIWIVRKILSGPRVSGGRNRQPRLAVTEAAVVDEKRRLVLVRRDNVEHLMMIGGPNDIIVEQEIVRLRPSLQPSPPQAAAEADKGFAASLAGGAVGAIAGTGAALKGAGDTIAEKSMETGKSAAGVAAGAGSASIAALGKAINKTSETAQKAGPAAVDTTKAAASTVTETAQKAGTAAVDTTKAAASTVTETAQKAGTAAVTAASGAGAAIAETAGKATESIAATAAPLPEQSRKATGSSTPATNRNEMDLPPQDANSDKNVAKNVNGAATDAHPPSDSIHEEISTDAADPELTGDENLESVLSEGLDIEFDLDDNATLPVETSAKGDELEDEMQRMLDDLAGKS